MSMGYGGSARIVLQDESTVVYEYLAYNLNDHKYKNIDRVYDGLITINKSAMVEPEIHVKNKKMSNGRKKILVKRIRHDVDYTSLFNTGKIRVENSSYCWYYVDQMNNIGMIATKIIFRIFQKYQDEGGLPEIVTVYY